MGISSHQFYPLSAINILREGLKLPMSSYCTLLYPILILSFISSSVFSLFRYLSFTPILADMTEGSRVIGKAYYMNPETDFLVSNIIDDLKKLCIRGFFYHIVSFVINSLLAIATIHVLSTACSTKIPLTTLKDLFSRFFNWSLKRSVITQLYVALFQVGIVLSLLLSVEVLTFFNAYYEEDQSNMIVLASGVIIALPACFCYLYLVMVWRTGVIISVVGEGCYGLEAIKKAGELLRGRRREATLVVLLEFLMAAVLYETYRISTINVPHRNKLAGLVVGVGNVVIEVGVNLFVWSVHTIYYYEIKKRNGEEIAMNGGFMRVPVAAQVDEGYP